MKLAQFWYFGHVSKSLVAKSTTVMNPNPGAEVKWVLCGKKVFADYPSNVDLLPPVEPRRPRPQPEHVGWTHSDEAGSWFLEARGAIQLT